MKPSIERLRNSLHALRNECDELEKEIAANAADCGEEGAMKAILLLAKTRDSCMEIDAFVTCFVERM